MTSVAINIRIDLSLQATLDEMNDYVLHVVSYDNVVNVIRLDAESETCLFCAYFPSVSS